MYIINDSMLSLLLRFIGKGHKVNFCNHKFIQKQIKDIQAHVDQFPVEEQELRAIEWIEKYAQEYRANWEKEMVANEFSKQRCEDCPLHEIDAAKHCGIHNNWLDLLHQYGDGKIDSNKYVENTLNLLTEYKEDLKVRLRDLNYDI